MDFRIRHHSKQHRDEWKVIHEEEMYLLDKREWEIEPLSELYPSPLAILKYEKGYYPIFSFRDKYDRGWIKEESKSHYYEGLTTNELSNIFISEVGTFIIKNSLSEGQKAWINLQLESMALLMGSYNPITEI